MKEIDLTSEVYREYHYIVDGQRGVYVIHSPLNVTIMDNGTHRVVDSTGVTHRPSPNFIALNWKAKEDQPKFVA